MFICTKLRVSACLIASVLSGCTYWNQSQISVDYYNINGNSTAALDKEIQRKGPKLVGGRHAVAVARIKIVPNVAFAPYPGGCRISNAKVVVDAKVTLPKWEGRAQASDDLGSAWDNIERYTRLHEAVHVAMAFRYAKYIETEIANLNQNVPCKTLRAHARKIVNKYLTEHDAAQKKFDADEQIRISKANEKKSAGKN